MPLHDTDGARIEELLEPLIAKFGPDKVQEHLEKLIGSASWSDFLRVSAIAKNVANRMERTHAVR